MDVAYTKKAKEDIAYWKHSGNQKIMTKISALVNDISQNPFEGLGKPENLKYSLVGLWSRRINQEHRIVYEIDAKKLLYTRQKGIIISYSDAVHN
ncbi:MAG: Txe/YoeB family addiction module toxin [Bacteroidetes bacterium]|nr:Txe/YoeB family addiction module toxin [Bacteroidota bacterium]